MKLVFFDKINCREQYTSVHVDNIWPIANRMQVLVGGLSKRFSTYHFLDSNPNRLACRCPVPCLRPDYSGLLGGPLRMFRQGSAWWWNEVIGLLLRPPQRLRLWLTDWLLLASKEIQPCRVNTCDWAIPIVHQNNILEIFIRHFALSLAKER